MEDENNQIHLELGDIIIIYCPTNDILHEQTFSIDYIDKERIQLINVQDFSPFTLKLSEEGVIRNEEHIEAIDLLYRAKEKGFARQHQLLPGTWLNIHFGGETPIIVTCEITNLEEDMIELTTFPEGDILYINFGYRGIPLDLSITSFESRAPPESRQGPQEEEGKEEKGQEKEGQEEKGQEEEGKEEESPPKGRRQEKTNQDTILRASDIFFGSEMAPLRQEINVTSQQQRFDIETQMNDLLEDMLSNVPKTKRTTLVLQTIHITLERFKQLRNEFSRTDIYGNILGKKHKGPHWKPLVEHLQKMDTSLYWILPVVKCIKKVYNIPDTDEYQDIVSLSTLDAIRDIDATVQQYKSNSGSIDHNKYAQLLMDWNRLFIPFEEIHPEMNRDILSSLPISTNITTLVNNLDNISSTVVNKGTVTTQRFVMQTYNPSETMEIKSIVVLPEPVVHFSRIQVPSTSLYIRSQLHLSFLAYWKLFTSKTNISDILIDIASPNQVEDVTFLEDIKQYIYHHPQEHGSNTMLHNYLHTVVPTTKTLFRAIKPYIQSTSTGIPTGTSFINVVASLEPFLVYTSDITYSLYQEITRFVKEQISKYNKTFLERGKLFISLKKLSSLSYFSTAKHLKLQNLFNDHWRSLIEDLSIPMDNKTSSEMLTDLLRENEGRLFQSALALENIHTMLPENISDIVSATSEINAPTNAEKCNSYMIAKQYDTEEKMEQDNGKTIYFDKKFDTTNYGLLDDKNGVLDKEFENAQKTMSPESYVTFLTKKLEDTFQFLNSDAVEMAEILTQGMKRVKDGHLAIVFSPDKDRIHYFKRVHNRWERDDTIDPNTLVNSQDLLCQFQNDCIQIEKKLIIECQPYPTNKKELAKQAMKAIVKEFDEKYRVSKEELEIQLNKQYDYYRYIGPVWKKLQETVRFQYNKQQYDMGVSSVGSDDIVVSPFLPLFHMIHGQSNFIKRQNDLIRFIQRFTRDAYSEDEDPHWRYCIQASTKLVPTFLYTLAASFIETPEQYITTLDTIVQTNGVLSEDGDAWVDKYSGYTIRQIDFSTNEDYIYRAVVEQDAGEAMRENRQAPSSVTIYTSKEGKMAFNVVSSLADFMGIRIDAHIEWIIKTIIFTLPTAIPSESEYKIRIEEMAKKGKSMASYKQVYHLTFIYLALGAFLIGVQTSIPMVKTRKTFPGCVRSFSGYPLDGTGNESGLQYIACVVYKIRSDAEPWSALKGVKETVIPGKLKEFIDRYYSNQPDVLRRYREKLEFLQTSINEDIIPEEHNLVSVWPQFLPPLVPIQLKAVQPLTKDFKAGLIQEMKSGSHSQRDKILIVESKIALFSLAIQERIQHCLQGKRALLVNAANEPFLENACCHSDEITALSYFEKEEPLITQYNKVVVSLSRTFDDIRSIQAAPFLISRFDSQNKYISLDNTFSEEIIYRCFVQICRFQSLLPIKPELLAICSEKPDYLFASDSITDKIRKLKQDGKVYDNAALLHLLQLIHRENILPRHGMDLFVFSPMQRFRNVLETVIEDPYLNKMSHLLVDTLNILLEQYDVQVKEDTSEMREAKNYLANKNESMRKELFAFINVYARGSKKEKRICKEMVERGMVWADAERKIEITDDSLYSAVTFMKNTIQNILSTYPTMISNRVNYENIAIPDHWRLSYTHQNDLVTKVRESYSLLQPFYEAENLVTSIQEKSVNLLLLMQETMFFSTTNDSYTVFDPRTTYLLFEHYLLLSLMMYIKDEEGEEGEEGKMDNDKETTADLLITYLRMMDREKSDIDASYESVMDVVFKISEREKDTFTDRLKVLTEEAREVDTILKINQLGVWSKGLQKGLTTYVRETYDEERDYMEKLSEVERGLRQKNRLVDDRNVDVFMEEALEQMDVDAEIDREVNDLGGLNEDYMNNGDYYNEGPEAEEDYE